MARIQIKRGYEDNISLTSLLDGEFGYDVDNNKLYIGVTEKGKTLVNPTYKLTKSGSTITLTGSDGTTTSVTDSNTTYTIDSALSSTSTNPVQNKVVNTAIASRVATSDLVTSFDIEATHTNSKVYNANAVLEFAGLVADELGAIQEDVSKCALKTSIPTKTSQLTNDSGFKTTDNNTTYTLTQDSNDGHKITLTPSTGSATTITIPDNNTTYSAATQSAAGLMSADDKKKLDGVAASANNYSHPTTSGNKHIPSGGSSGQILRWSADGTATWGAETTSSYTLPTATSSTLGGVKIGSNISVSSGTISLTKDNVTTALGYTPPTTNTTYSVVSTSADGLCPKRGGTTTKFLRDDGTWATPPDTNTTYSAATTSANGLMTSTMVTKLNGIATGAQVNNLVVSTSTPTASTAEAWINPNGQTTITSLQNRIAVLEDDTGWKNLTLASGVSAVRARIRRKCGIVFLEIINLTGWTTQTTFTTIPEGFRPDTASVNNTYRWAAPTTGANWTRPEFKADGGLCIFTTTTTAGAWTDVIVSYIPVGY